MSLKKILLAGLITLLLNAPLNTKEFKKPKLKINFDYSFGNKQEKTEFHKSNSSFFAVPKVFETYSDKPELNSSENEDVKEVFLDIQNGTINSYGKLLKSMEKFSDKQKLIFSQAMRSLVELYGTDNSLFESEVIPQEDFFKKTQDSLANNTKNGLGVCKHNASHIERLLNDLGVESTMVSGTGGSNRGHTYVLSKTKDKIFLIDNGLYEFNSKNIEKILLGYQKNIGTTTFQHLFLKGDQPKYRLITEDGRNFLNFIGYDESSKPLKEILMKAPKKQEDLELNITHTNSMSSIELDCFGFFTKLGKISGSPDSAMQELYLGQTGFGKKLSIHKAVRLNLDASFIYGFLNQDTTKGKSSVFGAKGDLNVATNREKGFNVSSRLAGAFALSNSCSNPLFIDALTGVAASYKILPKKNISLEPYVSLQLGCLPVDAGKLWFAPIFSELDIGMAADFKLNKNNNFSFDLTGLFKLWEFGGKIKFNFENENFGTNLEAYGTKSTYTFCPDKYGVNLGAYVKSKNATIGASYKLEGTNYDGEIDNKHLFEINTSIKL